MFAVRMDGVDAGMCWDHLDLAEVRIVVLGASGLWLAVGLFL